MKYKCSPGMMCQRCYDKEHPRSRPETASKRPASAAAVATDVPAPKRHRRTHSDPGEPVNLTRKRTRAQPPTAVSAAKKTRVHIPAVDPSLLLDQQHAQRLALIAAEKTCAQPVKRTAKKTVAHPATWRLVVCD